MTWLRRMTPVWLRGAAVALFVGGLVWLGSLEGLERWGLSLLFHLRGPQPPQAPVVIVSIDEDSFDELDLVWPWPRALHAGFLDIVSQGKPAAIGFDILFAEPSLRGPEDDREFADAVRRAGNVVLAAALTTVEERGYTKSDLNPPLPSLREPAFGFGAVNFVVDDDAYVRSADLSREYQDKPLPNFDLELYRAAVEAGMAAASIEQPRFLINYQGGRKTYPTVPYYRVLNGEIAPEFFAGRIVLVGATSPVLHDLHPTPVALHGDMPGIEIHANALETLLRGIPIQRAPQAVVMAILLVGGVLAVWVTMKLRPLTGFGVIWAVAAAYAAVVWAVFVWARVWMDLVALPIALFTGYGATVLENFIQEQRRRALLMNLFSRHVSSEVAETIWREREQFMDGGRPRSQKLTATILFTDLAGFTTIAERMDPQQLMDWLNAYMEGMVALVTQHKGVVDDYGGDAIKADFGVPIARTTDAEIKQDALNAISCALAMEREVRRLNEQFQAKNLPSVAMRVGIATGSVVAGSMGGSDRLKYTTLGDTVNVAARLEGFQKELVDPLVTPCRIHIDEETAAYVEKEVQLLRIGEANLKGKGKKKTVFQVLGWADRAKAAEIGVQSRRAVRVKIQGVVTLYDHEMTIDVPFWDLSKTGLSVHGLTLKFPEQQAIHARFNLPGTGHVLTVSGRIVWNMGEKAGLQFFDMKQNDEAIIEKFLAKRGLKPAVEKRKKRTLIGPSA